MTSDAEASAAPVVFLMGPTAAGKTALALELVRRLPCDIISVDSAMVYRGMDIGTGKPAAEVLARAPHRLIDIRDPEESYSAAQFRADARREIDAIRRRGRVPLLVGGTGLYFRALRDGITPLPAADPAVRERLSADAQAGGWQRLHRRLARLDPASAARIHRNDAQRIQRALEVHELTGEPLSEVLRRPRERPLGLPVAGLVLAPADRARLHRAIAERFGRMLEQGLIAEVSHLRERPLMHARLPSMRAVGYRQVWEYLAGGADRTTMERNAVAATRQLARRQLTWLRSERGASWFDSHDPGLLDQVLATLRRVTHHGL